jgi:hypothetical protein
LSFFRLRILARRKGCFSLVDRITRRLPYHSLTSNGEIVMRRTIIPFALLIAFAAMPAGAQEEFKTSELFPVLPYNVWTYRIQGQEDKLTVSVFDFKEKSGDRIYRFEGRLRNQTVSSEHLSIRKDGVYRIRHDNMEIEPALLICPSSPVKGKTWKSVYKINDKKTTVTYECDTEEIIDRKNNKVKALVIRAHISEEKGEITNTCWYIPKDGLVKQVIEEGDSKIVLELENYGRAGPGSKKSP